VAGAPTGPAPEEAATRPAGDVAVRL
jgi:hypothetical protein